MFVFYCFCFVSYVLALNSVDLETNKWLINFWWYLKKLNIANFCNRLCSCNILTNCIYTITCAVFKHFITFYFIKELKVILQQHFLPFLPSLENTICSRKGSIPEAQLKFFIIIQQKEFNTNEGHFTTIFVPYVLVDRA